MGIILGRIRGKKAAKVAEQEQQAKIRKLCDLFPALEEETLASVLEENEGDVNKTIEVG